MNGYLWTGIAVLILGACDSQAPGGTGGAGGAHDAGAGGGAGDASAGGAGGSMTTSSSTSTLTATACADPGLPPGRIALGGTASQSKMVLRFSNPGPSCDDPKPWGAACCSYSYTDITLAPDQQTVGVHQLEPVACYREWKTYIDQCQGSTFQSGSCVKPPSAGLTIEVISIDATQITWREEEPSSDGDAGTWGTTVTTPRCP